MSSSHARQVSRNWIFSNPCLIELVENTLALPQESLHAFGVCDQRCHSTRYAGYARAQQK